MYRCEEEAGDPDVPDIALVWDGTVSSITPWGQLKAIPLLQDGGTEEESLDHSTPTCGVVIHAGW